ncbi:hypothetical protein BZG35_13250 [Brevundimonas sp. LM2]|uniref:FkbM family methyltransferase n=1 Tax=Brevundimonas sp. LM2 TaxID=1938605 RepID=UPI000983F53F|nr:FkbM family methyltransferase [Brevundimonas sp. LM2]AQR62504.1 hypothetical protein BZG35_13250 [Brevundimonas sp. LM2]
MRTPTKKYALKHLQQRGIPVGTVLDVGVLHGTPELVDAFPGHHHVLFEPVREFYPFIARAYEYVEHTLVEVAVSDTTGTVTLSLATVIDGMDVSHARVAEAGKEGQREVAATTLDDYLAGNTTLAKPYLLKVDVDGHELSILKGARQSLADCSVIIVEVQLDNLKARTDFLIANGFQIYDVVDLCYYGGQLAQFDVVFVNVEAAKAAKANLYEDGPFDYSKWVTYEG